MRSDLIESSGVCVCVRALDQGNISILPLFTPTDSKSCTFASASASALAWLMANGKRAPGACSMEMVRRRRLSTARSHIAEAEILLV